MLCALIIERNCGGENNNNNSIENLLPEFYNNKLFETMNANKHESEERTKEQNQTNEHTQRNAYILELCDGVRLMKNE